MVSSSGEIEYKCAKSRPHFVPYQRSLRGVPALALLLQTSNDLVLGAHHGGEDSIFLLQFPVVTGHLQCLTCCKDEFHYN